MELVDAVGGVEFDVPVEMYYSDPTQDLNIFFQPGMQHLDGQAAMEVCRFRKNGDGTGYPLGDIQRSETVRNLMVTVAKKLVSNIGKLDQFVDIFQRNIETNLSGTDITWFVTKAIGVNLSTGVTGGALPGDGNTTYRGTSYCYELEPAESLTMINQLVNPYTTSLTPEDVNFFQVNDANGRGMRQTPVCLRPQRPKTDRRARAARTPLSGTRNMTDPAETRRADEASASSFLRQGRELTDIK